MSETYNPLELDQQLCFKLYAASRAVIRGYKPMLDELGLTYPQYLVMLVLWEWAEKKPIQPTVKALGQRLQLDSGTLTPLLKRLEALQLVTRQRAVGDEREVHLALTAAGRQLRLQALPLHESLRCRLTLQAEHLQRLAQGLDLLLQELSEAN